MSDDKDLPSRLAQISLGISAVLLVGLLTTWWLTSSLMALSQAVDSLVDVFAGMAMAWAATMSAEPADEQHPMGHHAAEPIASLLVAILASALAVEVVRSGVVAVWTGATPSLPYFLLAALATKAAIKAVIWWVAARAVKSSRSPVLRAIQIDARNDVALGTLAVLGFFAARAGLASLDAWIAIPVGLWVGWGGFELARENVDMLMGISADPGRISELTELIESVPGVLETHDLVARLQGPELEVSAHVVLGRDISLHEAHDIGVDVERTVLQCPDVIRVSIHLDVEDDRDHG